MSILLSHCLKKWCSVITMVNEKQNNQFRPRKFKWCSKSWFCDFYIKLLGILMEKQTIPCTCVAQLFRHHPPKWKRTQLDSLCSTCLGCRPCALVGVLGRGNLWMFLSNLDVSPLLSLLPSPPKIKKNLVKLKRKTQKL